jgi:hypothetical protein
MFFPGIIRQESATYLAASGQTQQPFLGRWLLLTAAMFIASALLYTIRLVLARRRTIDIDDRSIAPSVREDPATGLGHWCSDSVDVDFLGQALEALWSKAFEG